MRKLTIDLDAICDALYILKRGENSLSPESRKLAQDELNKIQEFANKLHNWSEPMDGYAYSESIELNFKEICE